MKEDLNLNSHYSCANANRDVPRLKQQLQQLQTEQDGSVELAQQLNHIKNELHDVKKKCGLR